jgi:ketoreductase RED1
MQSNRSPEQLLEQYRHVSVIGVGLIGMSWTSLFLARGLHVRVYDPRPDLEAAVHKGVEQAAPTLNALGLPTQNLLQRLKIVQDPEAAVEGADLVQESGPENLPMKQEIWGRIGRKASPQALLLSSSSTFGATDISRNMPDARRMLIGHPFNPPYLVPLVEVVPGERTDPAAVAEAVAFYTALGKKPIALHKEIAGFVANRLQAVIFGEAIHLVTQGVVTVDELDDVMTSSIGLRWAVTGILQSFHCGGGAGGMKHFLEHIGPPFERIWRESGTARLDEATIAFVSNQATEKFGTNFQEMGTLRDRKQIAILKTLREAAQPQAASR